MSNFTILSSINLADRCYLFEVLLWCAFGRPPVVAYSLYDDDDARFGTDARSNMHAFVPDGPELSEAECAYAGLSPDPRLAALIDDTESSPLEHYDKLLETAERIVVTHPEGYAVLLANRAEAEKFHERLNKWLPEYHDYIDQFKQEICVALRKGDLTAFGTKVPESDPKKAREILDEDIDWLEGISELEMPRNEWIYSAIDWDDSAILGRQNFYVRAHLIVSEVMRQFPPDFLITTKNAVQVGDCYILPETGPIFGGKPISNRGRPSLPWSDFHVEVARMYRDGEMPEKKEAAIAVLQEWFEKTIGKTVSRAAIGHKLKPYFDGLRNLDRN